MLVQIYMYNSESRTSREISLNSSLEAIYVHHMVADTTYTIQMSAVSRKGEGLRSQLIVIGTAPARDGSIGEWAEGAMSPQSKVWSPTAVPQNEIFGECN